MNHRKNQTLLYYQFHQLQQATSEKIDSFINRIFQHADKCEFKSKNTACTSRDTIHETLIRDQIIIRTNNTTIREQALEKELNLTALISILVKLRLQKKLQKSWILNLLVALFNSIPYMMKLSHLH